MKIKALTLWQPWASLMANGHKTIETRSWRTNYRGLLAIHAAKKQGDKSQGMAELIAKGNDHVPIPLEEMPYGAVVCVVRLVGIMSTQLAATVSRGQYPSHEFDYGDYSAGRYAWLTELVHKFDDPILVTGRQVLWNWEVPDSVVIPLMEAV